MTFDRSGELFSTYQPKEVEEKWYQYWEENGCFSSENNPGGKPYSIVMPPPNVTGQLHMGHALDNTMQDIFQPLAQDAGKKGALATRDRPCRNRYAGKS